MNDGKVTGGIVKECADAWTPAGVRRVLFTVLLRDSRGQTSLWKCEAEGADEWLDSLVQEGEVGRGVTLGYELAGRPFTKGDVQVGECRFLRVHEVEFQKREVAV
jgi:hypothetical protein